MKHFTIKAICVLFVSNVIGSIDRFLTGKLAAPSIFAHYTIASNLALRLASLSGSVAGPVFHNTSRGLTDGTHPRPGQIFDETISFILPWFAFATSWILVWNDTLAALWLGAEVGHGTAPFLFPLVAAYSFTAITTIAETQLAPLNRLGLQLAFKTAVNLLAIPAIYLGWVCGGAIGVAYGFMFSRTAFIVQDLYVARILGARGWLSPAIRKTLLFQAVVALSFSAARIPMAHSRLWQLSFAILHAAIVGAHILSSMGFLWRRNMRVRTP